jgi:hypothetical protein
MSSTGAVVPTTSDRFRELLYSNDLSRNAVMLELTITAQRLQEIRSSMPDIKKVGILPWL